MTIFLRFQLRIGRRKATTAAPELMPRIPIMKLATAETIRPVAMNFLILLWSARKPFTNLPAAYAQ